MCILDAFEEGASGRRVQNTPVRSVEIFGTKYGTKYFCALLSIENRVPAACRLAGLLYYHYISGWASQFGPGQESVAGRPVLVRHIPPCEPHTEAAVIGTWNTTALQLMFGELAPTAVLSDVSVLVGYRLRPGLVLHTHARQPSWIFNKKVKIFNNSQTVKKFLIKVFNKNLVKISLKF